MRLPVSLIVVALLATAFLSGVTGCSSLAEQGVSRTEPSPVVSSSDATEQAQAFLETFFDAWAAKNSAAAERLLSEERRGMTWEFDKLDRIEFGAIMPSPDRIPEYIASGLGSVTQVTADDVRCFAASVTFHYRPGEAGASTGGEQLNWHWFLERGPEGSWFVTDWGY